MTVTSREQFEATFSDELHTKVMWECWQESRKALEAEQAQAVEPVAIYQGAGNFRFTGRVATIHTGTELFTHPAPPAQQVAVPAKVGDSRFESWYSELQQAGKGSKQIAREAYEAGLNEAQQVAVPDDAIIKEIERAIVDHCTGGDLWMSASLGKDRIKRLMEAQGVKV